MKPLWQNVQQEAPDELVGGERHRAIPGRPAKAIVLVAEGHPALVERDEPSPPPARVGRAPASINRPARTARLLWESYAVVYEGLREDKPAREVRREVEDEV